MTALRFTRVVFGVSSSLFLLNATINHHHHLLRVKSILIFVNIFYLSYYCWHSSVNNRIVPTSKWPPSLFPSHLTPWMNCYSYQTVQKTLAWPGDSTDTLRVAPKQVWVTQKIGKKAILYSHSFRHLQLLLLPNHFIRGIMVLGWC